MKMILTAIAIALVPAALMAQDHSHMQHQSGMTQKSGRSGASPLSEGGQAAFAAIQEAVARLEADPNTDWSKVDVEALRAHLIDMDNVVARAAVTQVPTQKGARFTITGVGPVVGSIQRMVAGHSMTMAGADGWQYRSSKTDKGAVLEVLSPDPRDVAKIRGLGFAGIMARGSHHQLHHYGIVTGAMSH